MGNNLSKLRDRNSLTQEKLAEILGRSVASIKKYESFEIELPLDSAKKLSEKYNVTLDWLYCNKEIETKISVVDILVAMRKIFRITRAETHNGTDVVLQMNYKFKEFLQSIDKMSFEYAEWTEYEEKYVVDKMHHVFTKHKQTLFEIFGEVDFNENKAIEINSIEFINEYLRCDDLFSILCIGDMDGMEEE